MCLADLTIIFSDLGDYNKALACGEEGLELARHTGYAHLIAYILYGLGGASLGLGNTKESYQYLGEAIRLALSKKLPHHTANALYYFAKLFIAEGQVTKAVQLLACVSEHPTTWQVMKNKAARLLEELEPKLSAEEFAKAKAEGKKLGLEEIVKNSL